MEDSSELLKALLGLLILGLLLGGMIYGLIVLFRGKKAVYRKPANLKLVAHARKGANQFVFHRNVISDLIFPSVWIIGFSALLLSSSDLSTALVGILLLTWFMFFRIYYIIRSRKDKVVIHGNEIEFHFLKETFKLDAKDYVEVNLEFRKTSSYNGSLVSPYLILTTEAKTESIFSNAAFAKYPHEVTEVIIASNPHLKAKKTWNDKIKLESESVPIQRTVG